LGSGRGRKRGVRFDAAGHSRIKGSEKGSLRRKKREIGRASAGGKKTKLTKGGKKKI